MKNIFLLEARSCKNYHTALSSTFMSRSTSALVALFLINIHASSSNYVTTALATSSTTSSGGTNQKENQINHNREQDEDHLQQAQLDEIEKKSSLPDDDTVVDAVANEEIVDKNVDNINIQKTSSLLHQHHHDKNENNEQQNENDESIKKTMTKGNSGITTDTTTTATSTVSSRSSISVEQLRDQESDDLQTSILKNEEMISTSSQNKNNVTTTNTARGIISTSTLSSSNINNDREDHDSISSTKKIITNQNNIDMNDTILASKSKNMSSTSTINRDYGTLGSSSSFISGGAPGHGNKDKNVDESNLDYYYNHVNNMLSSFKYYLNYIFSGKFSSWTTIMSIIVRRSSSASSVSHKNAGDESTTDYNSSLAWPWNWLLEMRIAFNDMMKLIENQKEDGSSTSSTRRTSIFDIFSDNQKNGGLQYLVRQGCDKHALRIPKAGSKTYYATNNYKNENSQGGKNFEDQQHENNNIKEGYNEAGMKSEKMPSTETSYNNTNDEQMVWEEMWMRNRNFFVELDMETMKEYFNASSIVPGAVVRASDTPLISVKNFPLIGAYRIHQVHQLHHKVLLQPSCFVYVTEFAPDWRVLPLTDLPEGIRNVIIRATGVREMSIPLRAPVPIPDNIHGEEIEALPQELFYVPEDAYEDLRGQEYTVVRVKPGPWWSGLKAFLSQQVIDLNDVTRIVIICALTISGIANLGGIRDEDGDHHED